MQNRFSVWYYGTLVLYRFLRSFSLEVRIWLKDYENLVDWSKESGRFPSCVPLVASDHRSSATSSGTVSSAVTFLFNIWNKSEIQFLKLGIIEIFYVPLQCLFSGKVFFDILSNTQARPFQCLREDFSQNIWYFTK